MARVASVDNEISRTNEFDEEGEAKLYHSFRHFWHPVMYSHELSNKPMPMTLCGEQLVIARLNGKASAFYDRCAHRGTPLSLGTIENDQLRCAYHGWRYDSNGHCTAIPQKPELVTRMRACVKSYRTAERYGMVWVCLVDNPRLPLPDFPQCEDKSIGLVTRYIPTADWNCSAPRRTENIVDLGHFPILHDGILGFKDKPQVPEHRVWQERDVLCMELIGHTFKMPNNPRYQALKIQSEVLNIHRRWTIHPPLTVLAEESGPAAEHRFFLLFHQTPMAPNKMRDFFIISRNYLTDDTEMDKMVEFSQFISHQDKPVVEAQRPQELPEDLSQELHVKGVDTFSVMYRQRLLALATELDK